MLINRAFAKTYVLSDDETERGGVSFHGETLDYFLCDLIGCGLFADFATIAEDGYIEDYSIPVEKVSAALSECGIMQIDGKEVSVC